MKENDKEKSDRFLSGLIQHNPTSDCTTTDGTGGHLITTPLTRCMTAHKDQIPRAIQTDWATSLQF